MPKYFFIFLSIFLLGSSMKAQKKFSISGIVTDSTSGETAIGANVYVKELMKGTATDVYGRYSLTLPEGEYTLVISYIGYKTQSIKIRLNENKRIDIKLIPDAIVTETFVVTDKAPEENIKSSEMSKLDLEMKQVKNLPVLFGEVDILKTIQLLPGVQSGGEGNTGFYVRGGGPDQNLILLDGAPVYNASHLFGFFSVFNGDAIKNVELYKGGMPAEYGGRLASVLDIQMKEGNNQKFHGEGGIGLIASRLTLEGPIVKNKSSFILSGRRTYAGELAQPFIKSTSRFKGSNYYFYDFNAKINYTIGDKDRLYLSGYFGRDVFVFNNKSDDFTMRSPWGNATATLRWNHIFNDKLFMNAMLLFTDYQFEVGIEQNNYEFKLLSGIRDYSAKVDFSYYPSISHHIKFGSHYIYHKFIPSSATARSGDLEFDTGGIIELFAHDLSIYASDDFDLNEKIRIHAGLRYSYFEHIGPFTRYVKNEFDRTVDTIFYKKGDHIADYHRLEPRFNIRYEINKKSSIKGSFTQNYQYIHLASLSGVSLPTDVWMPSTEIVKPQLSTQYAIGYFRNFKDNQWETSVEAFYKDMKNLVEYKEGALPQSNVGDNIDNLLTFGTGRAYGVEFYVKKTIGKINGWIGYTLSKTDRTFPKINQGKTFPAKYDRRHDVSLAATYEINKRLSASLVFVYGTGNAITLPVSRYILGGYLVNEYSARNAFRMADYHRLDLSIVWQGKENKKFQNSWVFAIYNVYNRYNPYFIYFSNEGNLLDGTLKIRAKQVSLFGIIPSITWNFKF